MNGIANANMEVKKGDTKPLTLYFTNENKTAIAITGWTIFFTVKKEIDDIDDDAVIKKTITNHTDPENGKSELKLSSSDTNIDSGNYLYDIQIKNTLGEIRTILEGIFTVTKDITQRTS